MKRRWLRWFVWLLTVAALVLAAFLQAGRFLAAPAQGPERADLIASLGGDSGARVLATAALYKQGMAPRVLLTGLEGSHATAREAYLHWRARRLEAEGVPASALLFDTSAASSWDDATVTLRLMREQGLKRVLVVSDPPHMRRLDWTFGKVFAGSGLEYRLVAAPMEGWDADRWWRRESSAAFVIMETIKLGYYLAAH